MDFNYTLKYRTFDELLEDVSIDLNTFALENMIEPQQLIKLARRLNYELGLRLNQTKEVILEVTHGKVRLPDDFYIWNYAMVCGNYQQTVGYDGYASGTNIQEIPYNEVPGNVDQCATATVNCTVCNANPCNQTAACKSCTTTSTATCTCTTDGTAGTCIVHNPQQPYGDTCVKPRVFLNCKNEAYELVQVVNQANVRTYSQLTPLRMKKSQNIDCDCPNLYHNAPNEGWLKNGFLFTTFQTGNVYLNYQGEMIDDEGNLMVPNHELLNEYYEYALKKRILENLALNGENVAQRLNLIMGELRAARNQALSFVNTPNFAEIKQIWVTNRKAQYARYYDMFSSYAPANSFPYNPDNRRVVS